VTVPNPQQGDQDGDGQGAGCDPDDDNDGVPWYLEMGTGSSDSDAANRPEHWACVPSAGPCAFYTVHPCLDGLDNDQDGATDLDDPACAVPDPGLDAFPGPTPPGGVYPVYNRLDLGGVPDQADALLVSGDVSFDHDLDGSVDSVQPVIGAAVVQRGEPETSGVRGVPAELRGFSLYGFDPLLGGFQMRLPAGDTGALNLTQASPFGDYPAYGQADFRFELDTTLRGLLGPATSGVFSSSIFWWPPFDSNWDSFGTPVDLSPSGGGPPVTRIESFRFNFERDTDFDGIFDRFDNCPRLSNPAQDDGDGDAYGDGCDCDPANGTVWDAPADLELGFFGFDLFWSPLALPGGLDEAVDVIRSGSPSDFTTGGTCVASDSMDGFVRDPTIPAPGGVVWYVARSQNGCPGVGRGSAGTDSNGVERPVRECP
jgi:hypothetical protein